MHKYFLCLMLCLTMFCSLSTLALAAEETVDDTGMAETVNTVEAEPSAEVEASEPEAAAEPAEPVEEPAAAETVEAAEAAEVQTVEPEITGPYFLVDGTAYADPAMTVCNGVYYVSLTNAVRALRPDAVITWEGEYAVVSGDGLTIRDRVGDQYLEANGRYLYIYNRVLTGNDQVLVPARIIAQAMGAWVEWHQDTGELEFHAGSGAIASGETFYDSDSVYWLSRIINVESGNQPLDGKLAVGTVIMNRVESPLFPGAQRRERHCRQADPGGHPGGRGQPLLCQRQHLPQQLGPAQPHLCHHHRGSLLLQLREPFLREKTGAVPAIRPGRPCTAYRKRIKSVGLATGEKCERGAGSPPFACSRKLFR